MSSPLLGCGSASACDPTTANVRVRVYACRLKIVCMCMAI